FVELEVTAAGVGKGAHRLAVGLPEVGEELIELGIDCLVDGRHHRAAVNRRRGRYGDLRRALGVRLHEFEMLDHRMAGKSELAGDAHPLVAGGDACKCNAGIHDVAFNAVETPEKIEVPPGATELSVGDGLQPHLLLLLDHAVDLAVLERLEFRRTAPGPRRFPAAPPPRARPARGSPWDGRGLGFCFVSCLPLSRRYHPPAVAGITPTPHPPPPRPAAASPTARPRPGYCLPRSR